MKKLIFGLALLASLLFAEHAFAYTVENGDTMTEIAQKHGLTLEELSMANPQIEDLDQIYVGQYINTNVIKNSPEIWSGINSSHQESIAQIEINTKIKSSTSSTNEKSVSKIGNFTEDEIDLLARIVRAEAQTEPFEGKVAVAAVVLNRVESPKFPNTIREVIYQRGQFQPVANGQINKPADKESIRAVYAALSDMRHIAKEALFFYNPAIATSRWLDSRVTAVVIGQHVFKN